MTDKKIDDGGFINCTRSDTPLGMMLTEGGITRRDWLAGMAMQGMLASGDWDWRKPKFSTERAYMFSDAMIAEGRKGVE